MFVVTASTLQRTLLWIIMAPFTSRIRLTGACSWFAGRRQAGLDPPESARTGALNGSIAAGRSLGTILACLLEQPSCWRGRHALASIVQISLGHEKGRMSVAKRAIHLLLVFALALFSLPIGASIGVATSPVTDDCCNEDAACTERDVSEANDASVNDDCCPGGCTHCLLACCGASVCTLPRAITSSRVDFTRGSAFFSLSIFPTIDPERIDHPPRL